MGNVRMMASPSQRVLLLVLTLLYFCLYGARLDAPHGLAFDEQHQVITAEQFTTLSGYHEWVHPPLGMTIMAASIKLLGDTYLAWRLPSLLAGWCSLLLVMALIRLLGGSLTTQICAAIFMLFDGLSFTMARIGMVNAIMVAFMLASLVATVRFWMAGRGGRKTALFFTGLFFGLSLGTKWTGFPVLLLFFYIFWQGKRTRAIEFPRLHEIAVYLIILPLETYFACYAIVPFIHGYSLRSVFLLQWEMLQFHLHLVCNHRYLSSWESWPFLIRPVWFFFQHHLSSGLNEGVICLGNPLVFAPLFIALGYSALKATSQPLAGVAYFGFMTQWLQWVPVARPSYFQYLYPAMPFAYVGLALLASALFSRRGFARVLSTAYLMAVVAMFAYWYPLYTAVPLTDRQWLQRMWFDTWI